MHMLLSGGGTIVAKLCAPRSHKVWSLLKVFIIKDLSSYEVFVLYFCKRFKVILVGIVKKLKNLSHCRFYYNLNF